MGFFRGGLLFIASILLLASFLVLNVTFTLSKSLEYENVQREIGPIAKELTTGENNIFEEVYFEDFNVSEVNDKISNDFKKYCQNNTDYTFVFEGKTISIPCSAVDQGPEAILNETLSDIVQEAYYKEYECGFWNCLKEKEVFFLVSEKAKDYWKDKFYFALLACLVIIAVMFLLVEHKLNWPILVGALLIASAAPLLKIKSIIAFFIPDNLQILTLFLNVFFSEAYFVFWVCLIIGLVLIGLGFGLKVSNLEFVKKLTAKQDKEKKEEKKEKNLKTQVLSARI